MLPVMEPKDPSHCLRRIDPEHNVARFYVLSLEPNLFGGTSLVRQWSRIATTGRQKVEIFESTNEAKAAQFHLVSV